MNSDFPFNRHSESLVVSYNQKNKSALVARALRYLDMHCNEELTLDAIAEELGCSKYYLIKSFRIQLGTTPMKLLWDFRIQKAAFALRNGKGISLVHLALENGFKSQSHFSGFFKRYFGLSPRGYIRKLRLDEIEIPEQLICENGEELFSAALVDSILGN